MSFMKGTPPQNCKQTKKPPKPKQTNKNPKKPKPNHAPAKGINTVTCV